jgi:long-chain acyl-CoA synthetase
MALTAQPTDSKPGEIGITVDGPAVGTTAPHIRELEPTPAEYPEVSTVAVFLNQSARLVEHTCLEFFVDNVRQGWTWAEAAKRARRVAAGLIQAGIRPEDRVVLLSPNRVEWLICDIAIQAAGAVTVPIYPSLVPTVVQQITANSGAVLAIVSGEALANKLSLNETLTSIVRMDGEVQEWMAQEIDGDTAVELEQRIRAITPESIVSILYTSGTTGDPKGVVLTQANFVKNARSELQVFEIGPKDVVLTFMPLSHIMSRHIAFICVMAGARDALSRGVDHLMEDVAEVRPTVMPGMPRLFDKVYASVYDKVNAGSGIEQRLFHWADRVGRQHLREGDSAGFGLRAEYALAKRLVLDSVRRKITGGRLRFFISGGAPLNPEVEEFFWMLGVQILQGWGLTETTSGATSNTEQYHRYTSVGKALPGTELRIAADGEILVRGPGVMREYYRDLTSTAEVFEDGWFKAGDIGRMDDDGFLFITDRKKDLLKTSGGKYVAPLLLETRLQLDRYIQSAVLIGDERPFVTALIVPNWANLAKDKGLVASAAELVKDSRVLAIIKEHLDLLNKELASFETIKHFSLIAEDFTEARDELTPTLKPKRRIIRDHYRELIDEMYAVATAAHKAALAATEDPPRARMPEA